MTRSGKPSNSRRSKNKQKFIVVCTGGRFPWSICQWNEPGYYTIVKRYEAREIATSITAKLNSGL